MPIASLTLLYRFHRTDTDRVGDSTEVSTCVRYLASRSTLTPLFLFPFESADESFLAYLRHIKTLIPLPLSPKGTLVPRLFDTSAIAQVLEG